MTKSSSISGAEVTSPVSKIQHSNPDDDSSVKTNFRIMRADRNFTIASKIKNKGDISKVLRLNVPTDKYDPMFYVSKGNNNTIDPRRNIIRIFDEEEFNPRLQIFTDDSKTKMGTDYASCVLLQLPPNSQ